MTTPTSRGQPTPNDADGTACFSSNGGHVLVQNHEIGGSEPFGVPALPGLVYDSGAGGGTTNIVVGPTGERLREYVSLAGTHNNCAGGSTPWNTWLTCEETEQKAGGRYLKDHGYVFEVDAFDQQANMDPVPLKFLGRYAHEAVAVDPAGTIYLTEDANDPHGLFFRWTPPAAISLVSPTRGKAYPLARNDLNDSEFTGPTFTQDAQVLFANIQSPGITFAITGPWGRPSNAQPT